MKKPSISNILIALSVIFAGVNVSHAQEYPVKPIKIIAPFPPGGPADIIGRLVGQRMAQDFGQPVTIDNRPGAGGNIGSDMVAKAAPDGYTLLIGFVGTHAINQSLYAKMPFDPVKDFEPVVRLAKVDMVLVVNPSVPARTVAELIALAKASPNQLSFGSPGRGTPHHLAGEMFNSKAGVQTLHVPYKGAVPALTDLIGGQISFAFSSMPTVLPFVKSGKLRALAVAGSVRSQAAPEIPTVAESGIPGFDVNNWYGIFAPHKTPKAVVDKLSTEVVRILATPDVKAGLAAQGVEPFVSTSEAFATYIKEEATKWSAVARDAKIPLE